MEQGPRRHVHAPRFGEGATPALHGDTIVVQWDDERQSFIAAFDKNTGEERWRTNRDEVSSWGTPLVVEHGGRFQVIATGTKNVTSYDLETGDVVWYGPGLTSNAIPSSVERDGIVYATSGFRGSRAFAVRLADAKGDITGTSAILWQLDRNTPYVPSPLLYEDILYLVKSNNAILTAVDPATGQAHYGPVRLDGIFEIYASPVGVAGNVIILGARRQCPRSRERTQAQGPGRELIRRRLRRIASVLRRRDVPPGLSLLVPNL